MTRLAKEIPGDVEYLFLFVGLKEPISLPNCNYWVWPNNTSLLGHQAMIDQYMSDPLIPGNMPIFISSGEIKSGQPVTNTLIALTFSKWEWFERWEHQPHKRRDDEYMDYKKQFEEQMIEQVLNVYPLLKKENIQYTNVSTPLSYKEYLNTVHGEAYGLAMTKRRFYVPDLLRPSTPIQGFYLTGQDICSLGFTGAMISGLFTSISILKWRILKLFI